MKTALILNPAAGGGRAGKAADSAVKRLGAMGFDVELLVTESPGHATELARETDAALVIAAGGDGTTFEVINGLAGRANPPTLGILPLGTGNSFLRDFDITCTDDAFAALSRKKSQPIDLVRIEHDDGQLHFVNLLSVGFTADAGHVTNQRYKALGVAGYVVATLQCLVTLSWPRFPYAMDGGELDSRDCTLLSFSNSQFTGGTMQMAPGADPSDGELDVIHIQPLGRRQFLAAFPKIFQGTHTQLDPIEHHRAKTVDFDLAEPADCMIDGEVLTLKLQRLVVEPAALELMA